MEIVKSILALLNEGYINLTQFTEMLVICHIHGTVRGSGYIGYDYEMQEWIDIP